MSPTPTSVTPVEPESTWRTRVSALGPGLLAASAAIGASHLVSSTQAGALFGWQLALVIVLANLLKYPFFRSGPQFAAETGLSLVEGYARKGRAYLWVFLALSLFAGVVSAAGVVLLCVVILSFLLPASWGLGVPLLAVVVVGVTLVLLLAGHYKALDGVTKVIVVTLAVSTVVAVATAATNPTVREATFVDPSPWNLATLPFLVALVGWMPAPIEVSAMNSLWVKAKQQDRRLATRDVLFDFNVGFVTSAVLALFFLALGVLVQYGNDEELQMAGGAYIPQLMSMYGDAIGGWAVPLMALIAFAAMFGTVITVIDGYARLIGESIRLLRGRERLERRGKDGWILAIGVVALGIVLWMSDQLATMLNFAMISAFVTAPVFAWLNFSLLRESRSLSPVLRVLAWVGLVFLAGFAVLFVLHLAGLVG
ncbi:divalent metal cation transporter [Ornithinimicrobium humiphilum]|uniref:Mn2+/Fe2+ NRAMP family transporter n=1 Tax=Ornithinimicrobium humiphilum TaxID=125288 RepID=A0A543KLN0_9MICO|nr:divalent metal cation transporter [Ornithinimicrobium humiphilum]TQM95993.1 Mn2+/Fe2+ NRAMP family transporter [Ornithinimicrobium humiphilum]